MPTIARLILPFLVSICFPLALPAQCDIHAPIIKRLRQFVEQKDPNILLSLQHPEYRYHYGEETSSRDGTVESLQETFDSVPDYKCTFEDLICTTDKIVWRWKVTGTMPGEEAPSLFEGISIMRIADGLIIEEWEVQNLIED